MTINKSGNRGRRRQTERLNLKSSWKPKTPSPLAALLTATILLLLIVVFPLALSTSSPRTNFGVTNSRVAMCPKNGTGKVLGTVPNWVGFRASPDTAGVLVGEEAREWAKGMEGGGEKGAVFDVRRLLGRNFSDLKLPERDSAFTFQEVEKNVDEQGQIINGTARRVLRYTPEQITAMIFGELKGIAEREVGENITQAVVATHLAPGFYPYVESTTPLPYNDRSYLPWQAADQFEEAYRTALRHAASLAGFEIIRFTREPVAAAIAYGLDTESIWDERTVLVYDLGETSLDVTVLSVEQGVFEVLASERVEGRFGGRKMDGNVAGWILREVAGRMNGGGQGDGRASHVRVEDIMMLGPKLVIKVKEEVAEGVKIALLEQEAVEIDVGELLTNLGGLERNLTMTRRDFEDVNHGLVWDTLPVVQRVLTAARVLRDKLDDFIVVGGSGKTPRVRWSVEQYYCTKSKPLMEGNVDSAEAVVFGAAVQAMGTTECIFIYDVPTSIGVETAGGVMTTIIRRNSPMPTLRSPMDLATVNQNNLPRGIPRVSIAFAIDHNGVLQVFLLDTIVMDDEGHHRHLIATIRTLYADASDKALAKWKKIDSLIEETDRFWEEDEETKATFEARRELAKMLNAVRRSLWIVEADGAAQEAATEEVRVIRDALRDAEVWLEEHWDVETNTSEEFMMEKKLLSGVVSPVLHPDDISVVVDELPPVMRTGRR
ncbi:Hsp70 protein-domain-containing protein [Pseudoneurospora amorphoporcata]|uniref:Hsp70 protein-domain-containing protein n=1 Tax=Pseudoneurospora amorphoporcata TaxID=241081 RepID=A0AAN6P1U6_9PEZI|nr:Hsp70 protein-domain-containing protein [Pseudoneurospora amorphoporcata]